MKLWLEGIGVWAPRMGSYPAMQQRLTGRLTPDAAPPAAMRLSASERRRAPAGAKLAVEVAGQALAMSGREPTSLACVFASAHGDQAITDELCHTLAHTPGAVSPTRFHHSGHNAPAGYWTMATDCHAPSSAVCAGAQTFGAALLEAISLALAEQRAVLLVASDSAGSGPLRAITGCTQTFGCALLLTPARAAHSMASLQVQLAAAGAPTPTPAPLAADTAGNPIAAAALPLLGLLADTGGRCRLRCADALDLLLDVERIA